MLLSGFIRNVYDVFRFNFVGALSHAFGHLEAVGVAKVAVCLCDKDAAVLVTQPTCNYLEVDADLDGVGAEVMTHAVVGKFWYAGLFSGIGHQGACSRDRGDLVRRGFGLS